MRAAAPLASKHASPCCQRAEVTEEHEFPPTLEGREVGIAGTIHLDSRITHTFERVGNLSYQKEEHDFWKGDTPPCLRSRFLLPPISEAISLTPRPGGWLVSAFGDQVSAGLPAANALRERTGNDSSLLIPVFSSTLLLCKGTAPVALPHHHHFGFSQMFAQKKPKFGPSSFWASRGISHPSWTPWAKLLERLLLTWQGRRWSWLWHRFFWGIKDKLS